MVLSSYFRFIIFGSLLFFSCAPNNPTTPDGKPDGKALYEQNCAVCHGEDGKMGSAGAKDLSVSALNAEQRFSIITNGKGAMTPFKDVLDEEQRKAVAAYLDELK